MGRPPTRGSSISAASIAPAGLQPSSKSAAAAPTLSHRDMEMGSLPATEETPISSTISTPLPDIMQLARTGEIAAMERLFETGDFDATYSDDEGITPLHWAAINNQYAMCSFLIESGAEINKKGGESVATPLQWAAQRCHYYTVNLLLQHGADPLVTDAQGYNTLHISTFNGNALLLILLLHQGIPVDVLDSYGHTPLMWAAYKGFPQCVDVFLRWGASVHATDEQGFTPLHWALVKGNPGCILKLIEYGADRFAKTDTGKTPALTASELNTMPAWHRALRECGYDEDGHVALPPWPGAANHFFLKDKRVFLTRALFLWPFFMIWLVVSLLAYAPIYLGLPLAAASAYGCTWCARQVLEYAPSDMRQFHKTPWMAGIFAASLFLTGVNWLTTVLPTTLQIQTEGSHTHLLNLAFFPVFGLTAFFYVASMRYDPGFVPKMKGIAEQRAVIDHLLKSWKFDESNFCTICMIRTPLRSKHCRRCQRCVARHDHHCPWVFNCVGVNNHRHFFFYLICLTVGIPLYDWLLYAYYSKVSANAPDTCNVLGPAICRLVNSDAYTLVLGVWISLQLTWVSMLLFTQFFQVSRAMTTYENMTGVRTASSLSSAFTSTGTPLDPSHPPSSITTSSSAGGGVVITANGHAHPHKRKAGLLNTWSQLLGVDPFIETITGRGAATTKNKRRKKNPYSRGCVVNCRDFWCDPAPIFSQRENGSALLGGDGVDYTAMYETPTMVQLATMRGRGGYDPVNTEEA